MSIVEHDVFRQKINAYKVDHLLMSTKEKVVFLSFVQ